MRFQGTTVLRESGLDGYIFVLPRVRTFKVFFSVQQWPLDTMLLLSSIFLLSLLLMQIGVYWFWAYLDPGGGG